MMEQPRGHVPKTQLVPQLGAYSLLVRRNVASVGRFNRAVASRTRSGVETVPVSCCCGAVRDGSVCFFAVLCASWRSSLPDPRSRVSARERALESGAFIRGGTVPLGRGSSTGGESPTGPRAKPVTLAPRLVARIAPLVAFGLGLRILAAGPAPISTVLRLRALCEPSRKVVAMNQEARPRGCPVSRTRRLGALRRSTVKRRAVIGRCCSNPSRRPPAGKTCLSSTSRAVSSKATETPFTVH